MTMTPAIEDIRYKKAPLEGSASFDIPEGLESAAFEISNDVERQAHLMNAMATLYAHGPSGVLREYASNAIDAHVVSGQTRPIEITLPKKDQVGLIIRDFGVGMSKETMLRVFTQYGVSEKGEDLRLIGFYGMGCKSGFSVSDRFQVSSVKDGWQTDALIHKDENDMGKMVILAYTKTDEPSGTTVTLPVDNNPTPYVEASKVIFSAWKTNTVKIDGVPNVNILDDMVEVNKHYFTSDISQPIRRRSWRDQVTVLNVVVAGFSYKVKIKDIDIEGAVNKEHTRECLKSMGEGILKFDIGELDFIPSRDSIALTPRTTAKIIATAEQSQQDYIELVQAALANIRITSLVDYMAVTTLINNARAYNRLLEHPDELLITSNRLDFSHHDFAIQKDGQIRMNRSRNLTVSNVINAIIPQDNTLADPTAIKFYVIKGNFDTYTSTFVRKVRAYLIADARRNDLDIEKSVVLWSDSEVLQRLLSPQIVSNEAVENTILRRNEVAPQRIREDAENNGPVNGNTRSTITYDLVEVSNAVPYSPLSRTGNVVYEEVIANQQDYIFHAPGERWDSITAVKGLKDALPHKQIILLNPRQRVQSFRARFPQVISAAEYYDVAIQEYIANFSDTEILKLTVFGTHAAKYFMDTGVTPNLADPELRQALTLASEGDRTKSWLITLPEDHRLYEKVTKLQYLHSKLRHMIGEEQGKQIAIFVFNSYYNGDL